MLLVVSVAGCATQPASRPATTVTVTRQPPAASHSGAPPPPVPATGTGASSSVPATLTTLPGTCEDMLPLPVIDNALNREVPGRTAFVVGVAEADIHRLGYVNCRYGLTSAQSAPAIEIGISLYRTAADAAARIPATVDDFLAHGSTDADTTVGGVPAHLLTGGSGAGYGPTVVLASGQRTLAVTLAAGASHDPRGDLATLAALALQRSAG